MEPGDERSGERRDGEGAGCVYRFGPFRADTGEGALYRDGAQIPLNHMAFELLRLLIEHRGELVTRERLMTLLWPDRIVEDANLTQTVFVLRKALADDREAGRYIQTVARRGYRFIAAVEELVEGADVPAPIPIHRGGSRRWTLAAAAGGLLAAAIVLAWWLVPWPGAASDGNAKASVRMSILPFAATNGDAELRLLALSLTDFLSRDLAEQGGLLLIGVPARLGSESKPAELLAFVRRSRVHYLVGGKLRRGGSTDKARLTLMLYDLDKENILHAVPLQSYDLAFPDDAATLARFVTARERIITDLRKQLLPSAGLGGVQPIPIAMTPRNAAAYRLYLRALYHVRQATCSGPQAVALLQSALERDPGFAPAWETLGWAQYNLVTFCGRSAGHYDDALRSAERALELVPNLPRAIALKAGIWVESGRIGEAYALLTKAGSRRPWQADLAWMRIYALRYAGYLERAAAGLDALLERNPVFLSVEGWTPNTLLYLGRYDAFLQYLPGGDAPIFVYYRALAKLLQGRRSEAATMLASVFPQSPHDPFARLAEALSAILAGDESSALERLNTLVLDRKRLGLHDGEMSYKLAQLFALAGDKEAALASLEQAVGQGFFSWPALRDDPLLVALHANPRFRTILDQAKRRHESFGRRFKLAPTLSPLPSSGRGSTTSLSPLPSAGRGSTTFLSPLPSAGRGSGRGILFHCDSECETTESVTIHSVLGFVVCELRIIQA